LSLVIALSPYVAARLSELFLHTLWWELAPGSSTELMLISTTQVDTECQERS